MENRPRLLSLCMQWLGGNHADAEDVLSRVSLKAIEFLTVEQRSVRHFKPWFTRSLRNACVDFLRAKNRICLTISVDGVSTERPDRAVANIELRVALERSIAELSPGIRQAFVLRVVDGISYHDIAQALEISPAAARKRVELARRRLRHELTFHHH